MEQVPINVYAEMTPNPNSMKFVANKYILLSHESAEFKSQADAKKYSPLATELFNFPFIKAVFLSANFVSVTKDDSISWDHVVMELRDFIKNYIADGKDILVMMPPKTETNPEIVAKLDIAPSEYDQTIKDLLDEYVRPAVEGDGGAIDFVGYKEGIVTVELKGSCSGCPSSTVTLKNGIETLLKQNLEQVKEVVALEG